MEVVVNDKFWFEDPSILYNKNRLIEFIPLNDHTYEEWLNSILRFSIYASILFYIFKREWVLLMFPYITACLTYYFYYRNKEYIDINDDEHFPCYRPNKENPLMNLLVSDYGYNQDRKPACDTRHVKKDIQKYINRNRYTNSFDVLADDFRERAYYTTPITTIPNNQHDFANWLYKNGDTCKTNTDHCFRDDDIRHDREPVTKNWINSL
jgi:hypothetical protein